MASSLREGAALLMTPAKAAREHTDIAKTYRRKHAPGQPKVRVGAKAYGILDKNAYRL